MYLYYPDLLEGENSTELRFVDFKNELTDLIKTEVSGVNVSYNHKYIAYNKDADRGDNRVELYSIEKKVLSNYP